MYILWHTSVPKFAFFVVPAAWMLVVHTMVVAVFRGSAVFVRTQAVGMRIRDAQLLVRTAKAILQMQTSHGGEKI